MDVKVFNLTPGVNETRFLVQQELGEINFELNESVYVIKCKNGIMMNVGVSVKN